jgi:hypothetical protein
MSREPLTRNMGGVPAECGGSALFDRRHDATFDPAEMGTVAMPERLAVAAEHVRHLQRRTHPDASVRRRNIEP